MNINVLKAAKAMKQGGVIAYPTEAVWGIGCDPWNPDAVEKVLSLKHRDRAKGVILVAANTQQVDFLLNPLSSSERVDVEATWPGPVTWVLDHHDLIPEWVSGGRSTVAIRVSDHPLVQQLCLAFGGPVVSTSANLSGRPAIKSSWVLLKQFRKQLDACLMGPLGGRQSPSTIRDLGSGKQLR